MTGLKDVRTLRVGDTLTTVETPATEALPGYKDVKPMVFAGLFPTDSDDYPELRDALERLQLNDGSLSFEPETSKALGFGFRCGFLGLLHLEIVRERLEREFDLDLLVTAPNVAYEVVTKSGERVEVHKPTEMPTDILAVEEPYIKATIIVPKDFVGTMMELAQDRRGTFGNLEYLSEERVLLTYDLPLAEIVLDFYDQLKSRTPGLRELRLRRDRLPRRRSRAPRHPPGWRSGRCAQPDRASRQGASARQSARREAGARRFPARCSTCRSRPRSGRELSRARR